MDNSIKKKMSKMFLEKVIIKNIKRNNLDWNN